MKRLLLIVLSALMLTACNQECETTGTTAAAPVAKGEAIKWKLVTSWPKNFPGLGTAPEKFAMLVNQMSAGRLQIKVYGAGELVPAVLPPGSGIRLNGA